MICNLCPRSCNATRDDKNANGFCKCESTMKVARIAPHYWEEPCISGKNGCGAVFFSGCTLKCVYCQNAEISHDNNGRYISETELSDEIKRLEDMGVHTIEFVSPTHYVDNIIKTLDIYKPRVPVIYNSSGYEKPETIRKLDGYVDVFLPDFKYSDDKLALRLSNCHNYPSTAIDTISEMIVQQPQCKFDSNGIITNGVVIRHLVLPNHTKNSIEVLKLIKAHFSGKVLVSLMGQYIPHFNSDAHPDINRKITLREYNKVLDELINLDLDGFAQELTSADESYIPQWEY